MGAGRVIASGSGVDSFGPRTRGVATGVRGFPLSNGAVLGLTTTWTGSGKEEGLDQDWISAIWASSRRVSPARTASSASNMAVSSS